MSEPRTFTREAVAASFIQRQWLDRPRGRRLSAKSLGGFIESTGGLQIDSINVLDRAHYLTAWSRFDHYAHSKLDSLIYRDRVLFEYWSHAACFVPRAHAAQWRRTMDDYRRQHTGWGRWLRKHAELLQSIESAVRERGPLGNIDFLGPRPKGSQGWWGWKPAAHALHFLWMSGRFMVHERTHFQKRYDLAERVLPGITAIEPPPFPEFLRWHIRRSLKAMGAATDMDLRMYLTYPRLPVGKRRAALQSLLKTGEVVPVNVAGDKQKWFALAAELPLLEAAGRMRAPSTGTTLLAPFDSLLWHRGRVQTLFGYDYKLEVYVPGHKRVHGYYSLPLFHDGQLIGRVDAKNHRAERRLEIRHVHFEPWAAAGKQPPTVRWEKFDREAALHGLGETVKSLARFEGAKSVSLGRVTPSKLAAAVAKVVSTAPIAGQTDAGKKRRKSQ